MEDEYVRQVALDVMRNPQRRFVLSHLNGQEAPLTTRGLAQAIVDRETAGGETTPGVRASADDRSTPAHRRLPLG